MGAFQEVGADRSLRAFLDYVALATDEDCCRPDQTHVTLATLHNATGRESPVVFIVGAEAENVRYWRYRQREVGLGEEGLELGMWACPELRGVYTRGASSVRPSEDATAHALAGPVPQEPSLESITTGRCKGADT